MSVGLRNLCALAVLSLGTVGCASTADPTAPPSEIPDAAMLRSEGQGADAWVYRAPGVDLARYTSFLIEPAELYRGPEASFASLSDADLAELTRPLGSETSRHVGVRPPVVTPPRPR